MACVQVAGVCWLNEHALAVVSEQGPRSHVRLYDASGQHLHLKHLKHTRA